MSRAVPLLFATFSVAAAAACILPYDRLEGGNPDAGGAIDAGVDATLDASSDAAADAADADATLRFCQAFTGVFCDDFDKKPIDQMWNTLAASAGGTIALDSAMPNSPPNALVVAAAQDAAFAYVSKTIAGAVGNVHHIGFAIRLAERDDTAGLFTLKHSGPGKPVLRWSVGGGAPKHSYVEENGLPADAGTSIVHSSPRVPPANVWMRVAIDVDFTNRTFEMRWDGESIMSFTFDPHVELDAPSLSILLGVVYVSAPTGGVWRVLYDDVLYRVE